jgi:hypothetical protein
MVTTSRVPAAGVSRPGGAAIRGIDGGIDGDRRGIDGDRRGQTDRETRGTDGTFPNFGETKRQRRAGLLLGIGCGFLWPSLQTESCSFLVHFGFPIPILAQTTGVRPVCPHVSRERSKSVAGCLQASF